jgi:hypothetical protein
MEEDWEGIGYTFEQAFTLNYFVQPFWTQCEADNGVTYMYTRQSEEGTLRTGKGIKVKQECLSPGVVVAMSISPPRAQGTPRRSPRGIIPEGGAVSVPTIFQKANIPLLLAIVVSFRC